MTPLVSLKGVSARYDHTPVISGVSLQIEAGDFLVVTGPNGGGKTTLLKVILSLLSPTEGIVEYAPVPHLFGYLPQNNRFDSRFPITVREVVQSGLFSHKGIWKRYTSEDDCKVVQLLQENGMERYADTPIGNLSGGEQQRALLCRALIGDPTIIILDEPTTYVDSDFAQELYHKLDHLKTKKTILMVSHEPEAVARFATRRIQVERGEVRDV